MPELGQLAGPVLGGGTGFHADQTGWQRLKDGEQLDASRLAPDSDLAVGVDGGVHLEPVFREIQTDGGTLHEKW